MLARPQKNPNRQVLANQSPSGAIAVDRPIYNLEQSSTSPREEISTVSQDINVLALVKGTERYVFLYDDANRAETLRTLGRFASNPDLSFTWYDAAVLSQKIRQDSHKFVSASRFEVPLPSDVSDDEY
jgi:hypothetical protein